MTKEQLIVAIVTAGLAAVAPIVTTLIGIILQQQTARDLRAEIGALRAETRAEIAALRSETRAESVALRNQVHADLLLIHERVAKVEGGYGN